MLFVTGNEDELVPHEMTLELHKQATSSVHKELYIVMGGTHNDTWYRGGKDYIKKLKQFLADCMHYPQQA